MLKEIDVKLLESSNGKAINRGWREDIAKSIEKMGDDAYCVPASLAHGCEVSYERAYKFCETKLNRKHGRGTIIDSIWQGGVKRVLGKRICFVGRVDPYRRSGPKNNYVKTYKVAGKKVDRNGTVGSFLKEYTEGTYLVGVDRHLFCIKDGVVLGNREDALQSRKQVHFFCKLK
jgi:hypothetical protein